MFKRKDNMNCAMKFSAAAISTLIQITSCCHSTEPPIQLPDTTSHNFLWTVELLGDGNSSVLHDVTIINDSIAYAVGTIYKQDSLDNWDVDAYNLARWDGRSWEPMRIQFFTFCGQTYTGSYPAKTIFAFGEKDIWIGMDGSQVVRWDGQRQTTPMCTPISLNRLWGKNSNAMYAVGYGGGIALFNGTSWQKIESGTTLPIQDIWGEVNAQTGSTEIYVVASNTIAVPSGKKLLRIDGTNAIAMSDSGLNVFLNSLWFSLGGPYYVVGGGFFYSQSINQSTIWQGGANVVTTFYSNAIRGNASNDIFLVGSSGDVVHFNGSSWKSFQQQTALSGNYWAVAVKGNLVIAVGEKRRSGGDRNRKEKVEIPTRKKKPRLV